MNEQSSINTEPRAAPTTGDENGYSDGYFAVGVKPQQIYDSEDCCDRLCCFDTSGSLKFSRVGNFTVLKESNSSDGGRTLQIVVGPNWKMLVFVTLPCVCLGPLVLCTTVLYDQPLWVKCVYALAIGLTVCALWATSTVDPGIVCRRPEKPNGFSTSDDVEAAISIESNYGTVEPIGSVWVWSDQAGTWRQKTAAFSRECDCVIEEIDHNCPWTGTVIAKNNIFAFYFFVGMCFILFYLSLYLVGSAIL